MGPESVDKMFTPNIVYTVLRLRRFIVPEGIVPYSGPVQQQTHRVKMTEGLTPSLPHKDLVRRKRPRKFKTLIVVQIPSKTPTEPQRQNIIRKRSTRIFVGGVIKPFSDLWGIRERGNLTDLT